MNNNLAKRHDKLKGYRDTIFFKTSDLEYLVIVGVIVTAVFCLCAILPIKIQPALVVGVVMILFQYLVYVFIRLYYRAGQAGYEVQEIVLYEGSLDNITFAFYRAGLKLKSKIGEYYIFTTNYRILSNSEFVVREVERFCKVQANPVLIRELKNYIELK